MYPHDEDQVDTASVKKEDCVLVLSIFKGVNFVVKERAGYRCKLLAKLTDADQLLETGVVDLTPGHTEPNFNAQLAWSFPKKEIQRLRSDGKSLKLECFLVKNEQELGELIGYIVLPVKEAFFMNSLHEVDPATARVHPLLGTRDPWRNYHPKIKLQLHIEAATKTVSTNRNSHKKEAKTSVTSGSGDTKIASNRPAFSKFTTVGAIHSLADPKKLNNSRTAPKLVQDQELPCTTEMGTNTCVMEKGNEDFLFVVNDKGYFELGEPSDTDDLYCMSITVVHANRLNLLEPLSDSAEACKWRVEYKSFGFHISSDPFELTQDNDARRGFVGDKATARIRSNGADFFKYLSDTSLHLQIFRIKPDSFDHPEQMGRAFLSLAELTKTNLQELAYNLEVLPTTSYRDSSTFLNQKPELKVTVELECMPAYFSNELKMSPSKSLQNNSNMQNDVEIQAEIGASSDLPVITGDEVDNSEKANKGGEPADLLFKNQEWRGVEISSQASSRENLADNQHEHEHDKLQLAVHRPVGPAEYGDSSIMEAGKYKVTVSFEELWLRSRDPITDDFVLYYQHHPMGLYEDVECFAMPAPTTSKDIDARLRCSKITDGVLNLTISLERLSNRLLAKPLTVNISPAKKYVEGNKAAPLAISLVPFGKVFFVQEINGKRFFKKNVSVLHRERQVKIGYLSCSIEVEILERFRETLLKPIAEVNEGRGKTVPAVRDEHRASRQVRIAEDEVATVTGTDLVDGNKLTHVENKAVLRKNEQDIDTWKLEQERIFRAELAEKEKAYLRILSEEWKKRDSDREAQITNQIRTLQQRETEIAREKALIAKREEDLKQLESEIKSASQLSTMEIRKQLEKEKLRTRCLQERSQIETETLQRRIQEYVADLEKKTGRILLLETKLRESEDEVAKLVASRNRWSDMEQSRKLDQLMTENLYLKQKLKDTESHRDEYRRRLSKMSADLENMKKQKNLNLEAENENLRVQLLANQQRSDLAKDRRAVKEVAGQLKSVYNFFETKSKTGVESICTPDPKRRDYKNLDGGDKREKHGDQHNARDLGAGNEVYEEIKRLVDKRSRLLCEGKYSKYDLVIRDIDSKLRNLEEPRITS